MKIVFFGLMYIDESSIETNPNLRMADGSIIDVYLKNASVLSKSLKKNAIEFCLLTNNKTYIQNNFPDISKVVEIECVTNVPKGSPFYSAHFKLDAFRYISTQTQVYGCFVDLDVVCIGETPQSLLNAVDLNIPLFYDISEQVVTVYGDQKIIEDLALLTGVQGPARWLGGEFISGDSLFFSELVGNIETVMGSYLENIHRLHHIGDEMFTNAALIKMQLNNRFIQDAGSLGIVSRYWSSNVRHKKLPFSHLENKFLAHLPADKKLIAQFYDSSMDTDLFWGFYKKKLFGIVIVNAIKTLARLLKMGVK